MQQGMAVRTLTFPAYDHSTAGNNNRGFVAAIVIKQLLINSIECFYHWRVFRLRVYVGSR